jgi:cysteinyl-tRNA synthetase
MRLHDTRTRGLVTLAPLEPGHVRLYTCGPTVYDFAHIGNFRTYVWEDLLRRTLQLQGFRVTQVMNITDIEDKIIAKAVAGGTTLEEVTAPYIRAFFEDLDVLRIERAEVYPRATEHVPEMIAIAERLEAAGLTYEGQGSLYFRIDAFQSYGRLSNLENRKIKVGARVDSDEYDKDDARDFVLWKGHRPGEPSWDSPWGPGRPGWHLECSAMSIKYLGETFDLHTGGVDNIFPHHENEIAQSEGDGASLRPHLGPLRAPPGGRREDGEVQGELLHAAGPHGARARPARAASAAAVHALPEPAELHLRFPGSGGRGPAAPRRSGQPPGARAGAPGEQPRRRSPCGDRRGGVPRRPADDLNVSVAVAAVFRLVRETHAALDRRELPQDSRARVQEVLARMDTVLAVLERPQESLDQRVAALIDERTQARAARDFARADRIRDELSAMGIVWRHAPGRAPVAARGVGQPRLRSGASEDRNRRPAAPRTRDGTAAVAHAAGHAA